MTNKEITRQNLEKILKELPILAEKMPIRQNFDMDKFGIYDEVMKNKMDHQCDSVGCGLGWSAELFDLNNPSFYNQNERFSYRQFGRDTFPYLYRDTITTITSDWAFLFSSVWASYQPTFDQFIERLKYFLDMEMSLGRWEYQRNSFKLETE